MLDEVKELRIKNYTYQQIADKLNNLGYYRKPNKVQKTNLPITKRIVQNLFDLKYIVMDNIVYKECFILYLPNEILVIIFSCDLNLSFFKKYIICL